MRKLKKSIFFGISGFFIGWATLNDTLAQVVYSSPWFFKSTDSVTVYFDANRGNGGLSNFSGSVYAHTGVITNVSTQWRYVKAAWGTSDPAVLMTALGNGLYRISFRPRTYYGVPSNETILKLAFVFRNSDGTVTGRNADGSDIFLDLSDSSRINCAITRPFIETGSPVISLTAGQSLAVTGIADTACRLEFSLDGIPFDSITGDSLVSTLTASSYGYHTVRLVANGATTSDTASASFLVNPAGQIAALPAGSKDGITYLNDSTIRFNLFAPYKQFVYVLGDFNNWQVDTAYLMHRTPDSTRYWLDITGLTPGREYVYQYFVDAAIKIADPYAEKILDPSNDNGIGSATYPTPTPYPTGRTTGVASVLQTARTPYTWQTVNFMRPAKQDLVIYELLIRDFRSAHNYQSIIDTLPYLQRLGINAIELMPVNEFNANQSWGYNPSFFFAPDKYYGTRESLKAFIDTCHARGIAVILDMVFNHQDLPSPMVQLYYNSAAGQPATNNPWFNTSAPHDFSVFFDMNHDSPHTRYFIDRVNEFWLNEYRVDGFRYDLAKGFTQRYTLGNSSLFAAYDSGRVYNIERMANQLWTVDSTAYVILELFADNSEETRYANDGMMLWGNSNYAYNQATMGYQSGSDFGGVSYKSRGWSVPHLIGYMESHDEERLMYKNIQYGAVSGSYSVKDTVTALKRMELAGAFYFTIPGPKMIWMGGELGYDVSINNPCRTCNRAFRWNYTADPDRQHVFDVWSALIELRKSEPVFRTNNFNMQLSTLSKTIHLNDPSMNVTVIGNFGLTAANINPVFQQTGWWYEYFSGDSINVSNVLSPLTLQAGEYRLYTTRRTYPSFSTNDIDEASSGIPAFGLQAFPNPSQGDFRIRYRLFESTDVDLKVFSLTGQTVALLLNGRQSAGDHDFSWNPASSGISGGCYLLRLTTPEGSTFVRLMIP